MNPVLVLADDRNCEEFLRAVLGDWPIELISSPEDLRERLKEGSFPLVIVTNFGVGPWQAIDCMPAERGFPVPCSSAEIRRTPSSGEQRLGS